MNARVTQARKKVKVYSCGRKKNETRGEKKMRKKLVRMFMSHFKDAISLKPVVTFQVFGYTWEIKSSKTRNASKVQWRTREIEKEKKRGFS